MSYACICYIIYTIQWYLDLGMASWQTRDIHHDERSHSASHELISSAASINCCCRATSASHICKPFAHWWLTCWSCQPPRILVGDHSPHKIFTFRFPEMKMIENNTFKATNQLMIPVLFLKKLALSKLGPKNPLVNLWRFHRFTPKITHLAIWNPERWCPYVERHLRPAWDSSAKRSFSFWSASRSFWIACSALDLDFLIATTWFCRSSWRNGTSGTGRNPRTWQFSHWS